MNINDITDIPQVPPENYLKEIFFKQEALLKEYQSIEGIPDYPFDIDALDSQIWIKDFLWRTVEEMMEALEAHYEGNEAHTIEEVADALHFIVEAMILAGVAPRTWDLKEMVTNLNDNILKSESFDDVCLRVCYAAGLTGNTLKSKRWKQTQMQTDTQKFESYLKDTLETVIVSFIVLRCSVEEIFIYYFKKSEVNNFRIRTKY